MNAVYGNNMYFCCLLIQNYAQDFYSHIPIDGGNHLSTK